MNINLSPNVLMNLVQTHRNMCNRPATLSRSTSIYAITIMLSMLQCILFYQISTNALRIRVKTELAWISSTNTFANVTQDTLGSTVKLVSPQPFQFVFLVRKIYINQSFVLWFVRLPWTLTVAAMTEIRISILCRT